MSLAANWYARPLTTMAFVWRIERADGVALGFTSHDRDLVRGGLVYASAPGMLPSAVRLKSLPRLSTQTQWPSLWRNRISHS